MSDDISIDVRMWEMLESMVPTHEEDRKTREELMKLLRSARTTEQRFRLRLGGAKDFIFHPPITQEDLAMSINLIRRHDNTSLVLESVVTFYENIDYHYIHCRTEEDK